jgi:hypothetical protein
MPVSSRATTKQISSGCYEKGAARLSRGAQLPSQRRNRRQHQKHDCNPVSSTNGSAAEFGRLMMSKGLGIFLAASRELARMSNSSSPACPTTEIRIISAQKILRD